MKHDHSDQDAPADVAAATGSCRRTNQTTPHPDRGRSCARHAAPVADPRRDARPPEGAAMRVPLVTSRR
jgi:hypothetical protein